MTNLLRRALRRVLDFAYRLDREAMWQQWERDHVAPLRGQIAILNEGMADLKEDRDALQVFYDRVVEEAEDLKAKLDEMRGKVDAANKTIRELTKDHVPAWDPHGKNINTTVAHTKPWYRR